MLNSKYLGESSRAKRQASKKIKKAASIIILKREVQKEIIDGYYKYLSSGEFPFIKLSSTNDRDRKHYGHII